MKTAPVVSPEEWKAAREKLLVKEKEHSDLAMRWRRSGAACRGWLLRRSTASRGPMVR